MNDKTYQVLLQFTLSPAGPVLVSSGSGNKLHPELPDNTFLMSYDGEQDAFVIPGSSLKGVIRHYLYRIQQNDRQVDALFGFVEKKDAKKSKISVSDAFADMKTAETTVRHSTALGSVSQSAKNGTLNNMQAVTNGAFAGNIRLKNVNKDEILMILNSLKAINRGEICVGGRISRGFGRMRITQFQMTASGGYDADLKPIIAGAFDSLDKALTAVIKGELERGN